MRILGIVLIVVGLIALLAGGISWTDRDTVADLGPVEITSEDRESIPISPIIGGVCVVAGLVLALGVGRRARP
jgi:hypothetical protein